MLRSSLIYPVAAVVGLLMIGCAGSSAPTAEGPGPRRAGQANSRPIPQPLDAPLSYRQALQRGTRTTTGEPGSSYWQQSAEYNLRARLYPVERRLEGTARIDYTNNSPDQLPVLYLNLYQNLHAAGAPRKGPAEVTGGLQLKRVAVDGLEITESEGEEGPGYEVEGTRMRVRLPRPMESGASIELAIDYSFQVPQAGADGRMGWSGDNLYFIAYWYPQMAVYDDVVGWQNDYFLGNAEFYAGFADYEMEIEAPPGWVLIATGTLENPQETLAPHVRERLALADTSDDVVRVIREDDFGLAATAPGTDGWLMWRFSAGGVRDVAFSATLESYWDAARTPVGDRDADGVEDYARIDAVYRALAPRWTETVRYGQHAIDFLSRFTGIPYPWPHMSAVEGSGIIGGGMEFPMMTLMGDYNERGDSALYYVTAHELAHMWVPMIVSNDERRYSWMDEGTTSFNENQARKEFFPGRDHDLGDQELYVAQARADSATEGEIMRWSDFHYTSTAFGRASYQKPASVLVALSAVLGDEIFLEAYRTYLKRWAYKHPYPWDMFNTFEAVSGQDLDWFWRSWYYERWTLDQAVAEVRSGADGTEIIIEDRGFAPMPVDLRITRGNEQTITRRIGVESWLAGATSVVVTLPPGTPVTRVEIDPERNYPDTDRSNNVWTR